MNEAASEVRCMLIPLRQGRLLLPNSTVAEVMGYRDPDPVDGAPDWVRGKVGWRQRDILVVDFERLLGRRDSAASVRQRIAVCYSLDPEASWPVLGLLSQGIPRLLRVDEEAIADAGAPVQDRDPVRMRVIVDGEELLVPDLDKLRQRLPAA